MSVITRPGQGCGHELRPGAQFCTVCGRRGADDGRCAVRAGEERGHDGVVPRRGRTTPDQGRRYRSRWPLAVGIVALLGATGVAAAVFIVQPFQNDQAGSRPISGTSCDRCAGFPARCQLRRTASRPFELSVLGSPLIKEIVVRPEVALKVSANSVHACLWLAGCLEFVAVSFRTPFT